ncbi:MULTISPECIES: helix-turn-helix domain-containing protein [unclassified Streptomyces]|uniref:helix-turn-helix domain-containing protein n=1 Tax=unclassified Streptomyces TaxID=2593676 RepID=UPI00081B77E7|nr:MULTISPECIES: helix-turn-helix transcriptional regulator [unclassified Streptomyces]MYQ88939.1 helix-turn-helix domain-containing protein [Streptomyces sp. SID4936]SCE56988.1 Helix-turn-helix domain-containing protein [Streptomyces sp. DvalAA-43]
MAARTSPTERQKRLGAEVRRLRTSADVSAEFAAGLLGVDRGKISNIEAGTRPISPDRLRTLACNCDCTDVKYVDALVEMAQSRGRNWWERYRGILPQGLLDIAELEQHAVRMRAAYSVHIPGLLQTSDHALALFRVVIPQLPEREVALRLAHRVERQEILDGDAPPPYTAIVHEAALRMQFGGRAVARAQLDHLLTKSEQTNITLLVIPFDAGAFPGAGQTVLYAEGPVPRLDTVQIDNSHGPVFVHSDVQLAKYRAHLDWMEKIALSPEKSRDFIHNIASQL